MSLLDKIRAAADKARAPEILEVRFPLSMPWSDGAACRYSVKDPNKTQDKPLRLQTDPMPASLRLLRVWPGDVEPALGASTPYQTGTLVLGLWSDESVYTGQRVGVCRLVDARAYPTPAVLTDGTPLRLRIVALDAAGLSTGANDLVALASNSHRGHLPPRVQLNVGDVLVTSDGDQYAVTAPLQRDLLGDTVGLSWQRGGQVQPTPGNGGGTGTPKPDDAYWKEPIL